MSNSQQVLSDKEADGNTVEHSEQETIVVDTDYQVGEISLTSNADYQVEEILLTSGADYQVGKNLLTSDADYQVGEISLTSNADYQVGENPLTTAADYQVGDLPLTSVRIGNSSAAVEVSEVMSLHADSFFLDPESVEWFSWADDCESLLGYFFESTKTNIHEQEIENETPEMEEVASLSGGFQGISFSGLDSSSSTGLGLDMMSSAEVTSYSFDQAGSVPPLLDPADSVSILVSIANAFSHVFLTNDSSNMNNYSEERDEGDSSVLIPDTYQNTFGQSICPLVETSQKQEIYQDVCHSHMDMEKTQGCGALNAVQLDKNETCSKNGSSTNIIPGKEDIHVENFLIERNTEPSTNGEKLTGEMNIQKSSLNNMIDAGLQVPMQQCLDTPREEYLQTSTVEIIITNKDNIPSSEITPEISVKLLPEKAPITTLFSSAKDPFYHIGRFLEKLNTKPEEEQQKLWDLLSDVIKSGLSVQTMQMKPETQLEKGEDLNIIESGDEKQIQLNSESNIVSEEKKITLVDENNIHTETNLNLNVSSIQLEPVANKTEEPDFEHPISRTQSFEQPGLNHQLSFAGQPDSHDNCRSAQNKSEPTHQPAMSCHEQKNNIPQVLECSCVNVDSVPFNPNIPAATSLPITDPSPQHLVLSETTGAQKESSRLTDQMSFYDSSIVRSKVLSVQPHVKLAPLDYGLTLKNKGLTQTGSLASVAKHCQASAELPPYSLLHLQGQGLSPAQQTEDLSSLITSATQTYGNNQNMTPAYFNLSSYPQAITPFDLEMGQMTSVSVLNYPMAGTVFPSRSGGYPQHNFGIPQSFPSMHTAAALRQNDFYNNQIRSSAIKHQQPQPATGVYPSFYPGTHSLTSKPIYDNILNAPYNMVNVPLPFMPTPVFSTNFPGTSGKWQITPMAPRAGTGQLRIPSFTPPIASHNINTNNYQKVVFKRDTSAGSQLLEDFRIGRSLSVSLGDLTDHMVEFSQDQHGSRFIQQLLERATQQERNLIFSEISVSACSLMTDAFGNYVIQKFLELGNMEQKQILIHKFKGQVLSLSLQTYGCRVVQKAVASVPLDLQMEITQELDGHVVRCALDQNGNHVIQKCVECVEPSHLQFVVDALKFQVLHLSSNIYGCRVIQRILEHCNHDQKKQILPELHMGLERLMHDQYGNYVVQHMLEHGSEEDRHQVFDIVQGRVCQLSQHKCASNVVEKCIVYSSCQERATLIDEVCNTVDTISKQSALLTMTENEFANYVVQKMIDLAKLPQRRQLMYSIRPLIPNLRKNVYGKYILAKLEKFFELESVDGGKG